MKSLADTSERDMSHRAHAAADAMRGEDSGERVRGEGGDGRVKRGEEPTLQVSFLETLLRLVKLRLKLIEKWGIQKLGAWTKPELIFEVLRHLQSMHYFLQLFDLMRELDDCGLAFQQLFIQICLIMLRDCVQISFFTKILLQNSELSSILPLLETYESELLDEHIHDLSCRLRS